MPQGGREKPASVLNEDTPLPNSGKSGLWQIKTAVPKKPVRRNVSHLFLGYLRDSGCRTLKRRLCSPARYLIRMRHIFLFLACFHNYTFFVAWRSTLFMNRFLRAPALAITETPQIRTYGQPSVHTPSSEQKSGKAGEAT